MKKPANFTTNLLANRQNPIHPSGRASIWRSLTPQLFLIVVLPLTALLIAITFGSLSLHQQAMRKLVAERDLASVRTASAAISEQAALRSAGLRLLSDHASGLSGPELERLLQKSQALNASFEYGLAFFDSTGRVEAALGDPAIWVAVVDRAFPKIASLLESETPSADLLYLTVRLPPHDEFFIAAFVVDPNGHRITAGVFSPAALVQPILHSEVSEGHSPSYLLLDNNRQILYRSGNLFQPDESPDHPGIAESLSGQSGATYLLSNGSEHVVAYSAVNSLGWGLIGEEPWEMVDTPLLRNTQAAPLVLAPVLLLTLLALWFAARQIVRPLQELEARSSRLASGEFEAIEDPVGGIMEVQQLQSELIQMARQLRVAQQTLHNYIGAITNAQEDERRRLARELHDETIQSLIALKQQVQLARMDITGCNHLEPLDDISAMTEQTIEELRRLIRALRPIYLEDLGLTAALEMLVREMGQTTDIPIRFTQAGDERRLEPNAELSLYRMAQEALSNVARHSHATRASLRIKFLPDQVLLEVEDDGQGFAAPRIRSEVMTNGHYGVLGLFERAELIGANLKIESAPGKGTKLSVMLQTDGQKIGNMALLPLAPGQYNR